MLKGLTHSVIALLLTLTPQLEGFQKTKLSQAQIQQLITIGAPDEVIFQEIRERGIDFAPTQKTVEDLQHRGAGPRTLTAVGDLVPGTSRARPPAHAVPKIWEGDVVAPRWTSHQKFLLVREGPQISGYYVYEPTDPSALGNLDEVAGTVSSDGSVRIVSDGGFLWKGRFVSSEVIEGKRPNGYEGKSPEFPFSLHVVRDAALGDMPSPLSPTNSDWGAFLVQFKGAVAQRNQSLLRVMMARTFYLQNSRIRTVDDVFRQLNWRELDKTLATGSVTTGQSAIGRKQESITEPHPCAKCVYAVLVSFRQDREGQWRWTGIAYPGD